MQNRFKVALLSGMLCACGSTDSATRGDESAAFVPLCQRSGLACNADSEKNAPNLLGAYVGTGQTVGTTSSLWEVGDMNTFDAVITQQTGDTVDGTFDMGSLHLDIKSGQLRGTAQSFTIFGTDTVSQTNCNTEVMAVIVGTRQAGGALTGKLALEFTKNISGSGCTADQLSGYPGTGAVFSYTATANQ